jgi:hypothetical protein
VASLLETCGRVFQQLDCCVCRLFMHGTPGQVPEDSASCGVCNFRCVASPASHLFPELVQQGIILLLGASFFLVASLLETCGRVFQQLDCCVCRLFMHGTPGQVPEDCAPCGVAMFAE